MRILLDTHSLLWFLTDDPRLSRQALTILRTAENDVVLSMASLWEIAIKSSLKKLVLAKPFAELFPQELMDNDIGLLPILLKHVSILADLPFHHRDPFDRLIISQAMAEELPVLSSDSAFLQYPVRVIW